MQVNSAEHDFILGVCLEEDDALTTLDDQADEASEALPLMERPTRKKRRGRKSEEGVLREIAQGDEEDQNALVTPFRIALAVKCNANKKGSMALMVIEANR